MSVCLNIVASVLFVMTVPNSLLQYHAIDRYLIGSHYYPHPTLVLNKVEKRMSFNLAYSQPLLTVGDDALDDRPGF